MTNIPIVASLSYPCLSSIYLSGGDVASNSISRTHELSCPSKLFFSLSLDPVIFQQEEIDTSATCCSPVLHPTSTLWLSLNRSVRNRCNRCGFGATIKPGLGRHQRCEMLVAHHHCGLPRGASAVGGGVSKQLNTTVVCIRCMALNLGGLWGGR